MDVSVSQMSFWILLGIGNNTEYSLAIISSEALYFFYPIDSRLILIFHDSHSLARIACCSLRPHGEGKFVAYWAYVP